MQTIEIQYLSPAVRRFLRRPQPVPLPTISATVLRFEWQFAVPPRWELLAAPQDLMLDGSPRPLSWTRRLFGPLGRPAESPVFNPLDSEAWRRAAGGDPPAASGRTDEQPTRQGFAPDGWTVWRATALDVPPTLTVVLWSPSDANVLGWITFLSCLAIGIQARTILLRGRQRIGMLAAAGWLVTALIAPSDLALAAGGALLGTLLAILVPPAWLRRERHAGRRTSPAATDTTQSAPRVASGTAGILAFVAASLLYWQTLSAQEPPVPNAEAGHAGVDVLDSAVLVPVGPDRQPLKGLSVVYVARPLLERLETLSSRQPRPPEYLIASAEYRGRVDEQRSVAIAAAFRVAVLVDRRPVRIELPIGGAFPASGGACTVNGAPHPLFPADEGRTLVLVWEPHPARSEAGGFLDVAVHLEAARSEPPPGDLVLNVPPAGSNRAVLDFGEPQASVDFAGAAGRTELSADGRTARADLGRTGVVVAAWSRGAAASVSSPLEPQARIYSLIGVQPARLDYQCRVVYTFDRGTVDQVAVRIPADAIVRQVTTAAGAGHSLAPLSSTESRLTVEFSRPQGGEFHFDLTMTLPLAGALDAIPLPPVVPVEIGPASRVVRVAGYEVGVTASSEFQLQTATSPASRATQIPTAAFLQAFARADEPPATLREPLEAWRLSEPLPLTVALKLRAPVRRVRLRQTGVVGRGELDWTLRAEVDVRDAPAWRHTLVIDPRMIVDSVSVRHDEAERLVRWSRADGRLELFLRDKSSGLQDVVVAGRVPIDDSGEAPLPLIQFEQSEAVDSRLQLYAGEGVTAELVASDGLAPDSTGADASLEDRGLSAVGRFRLLHPLSLTPRLRWRMRPPDAAGEVRGAAGTVLAPAGEGSWTARTWLRLPAAAAVQGELRVNVPSSGVDELRVESAADHRLEGPVDGVVHVVLSATDGRAGELDVLIAQPVRPANGTLWDLLSPTVDQWPAMQHWLILPASSPLRPEGDSARPRPLAELPEWLCEQAAIDRTSTDWTAYDSSSAAWRLVDRSEHAPTRVPTAALLESLIHVTTDGRRMGRTTLAAGSRPPQRAEFDWPAGMRLRAAVVDGSPAEARITAVDDAAELLSVSARDGQPMQFVTLVWEQTSTGTPGWIDALAQPLPTPRHPAVSTSRLVVTGAKTRGALMGGTLGQPAPPDQQRLATLDRELARLRSEQEPAQAAGPRQNGSADPAPLLVLHGPTPSSDAGSAWAAGTLPVGPQPHVLRLWTFDRRVPVGALVLLGAALAVWLSSHAARLEPGERLGRHPQATMVVVGIVCWLCLVPGMLGFLLSVATVLFAARRLIRREPEPAPPRPA
ncbi:MAG TPA: hypothetical protein VML55_23160 [Planctomycetaceae bacterium]|nr:hypothetical protein [Planctomycetaceae bacterium]